MLGVAAELDEGGPVVRRVVKSSSSSSSTASSANLLLLHVGGPWSVDGPGNASSCTGLDDARRGASCS